MQLLLGPETLQDNEMQLLGIAVNLVHRVVICMSCHPALLPEKLYDHIRKYGHHKCKDFGKGQRLAFVTQKFCDQFSNIHNLNNPLFPIA
jgi:hypothetical protein